MANTVSCSRCRNVVPQAETEFSNSGEMLCLSCANLHQAHARVERSRQDTYERTAGGHSDLGYVMALAERGAADRDAARHHADLYAIEAAGSMAGPTELTCSRCGKTVPASKSTYARDGRPICPACFATYDERAERLKAEGTITTGFMLGFFMWVVGLGIVLYRGKSAERKGVWIGFLASSIVYLPLSCVVLAKL